MFVGKKAKLDVVFILGATGQNAEQTFKTQKEFVIKLFDEYKISSEDMLPGLVTYSARNVINIGDVSNKKDAVDVFRKLRFIDSGTNAVIALQRSASDVLTTEKGARKNVPKFVLLFVDDEDQINDSLRNHIKDFEDRNIKVVIVAIGPDITADKATKLSSDNVDVIYVSRPTMLIDQVAKVGKLLSEGWYFIKLLIIISNWFCEV